MMDELMEADEYFGEEDEWIEEDSFEDSWMELEKARGEKVIKCSKVKRRASKKNPNKTAHHELILTFEDTDNLDVEETYEIKITANNIIVGKHNGTNTSFKEVDLKKLNGKRLLEYVAGQIENTTGTELKLTLAFEKGFSIEITDYNSIEEHK